MKQPVLTSLLTCLTVMTAAAQGTYSIKGRVLDKLTGEELPGATVQVTGNGVNTGAGTEASGTYAVPNLKPGTYVVKASFIGYKPSQQTVTIGNQNSVATFRLDADNATLNEVQVVGTLGIAVERETPVAYSTVNEVKLRETLSNRDLPMILNETPGVYATQSGGGSGDSRINIRGFDQRNVAVMVNGVPVNDMENGAVYWSNWDLGDVTQSLQVQRGLSASKIAVPSVGGTINVVTKGFDSKKAVLARLETGSNNYRKASLMLSSGNVKDWTFTAFGSRRTSDGWVDKAYDDAWTYFANISKRIGNHRLSLTGMGSPQSHGQRTFQAQVGLYSDEKARELGARLVNNGNRGFKYNPYWGSLTRYKYDPGTNSTYDFGKEETLNERSNYYHKPQINLNDYWQVNDRLFISTVLYASYGRGGGVSGLTSGNSSTIRANSATGQTDFQGIYDFNVLNYPKVGGVPNYNEERQSTQFLINNVNNHRWYGFVVGGDYKLKENLTLSAGVDGRSYYGLHYREVRDLLGGDYVRPIADRNSDPNSRLRVGDKLSYNYDGKTRWIGGYSQVEYKTPVFSAVLSGTLSEIRYKRIDYFQPKVVNVNGQTYPVAFGQTQVIDGQTYTNADGSYVETDWVKFRGYSVKGGANYNLTERNNLFFNVGYNSKVPFFNFVFNTQGRQFSGVKPEGITSVELGYGITYPSLKATLNAYYTLWANKTTTSFQTLDGVPTYTNVRNVDARHMGIEMAVAQDISRRLQLNAAISLGDWRWVGKGLVNQTNEANEIIGEPDQPVYLDGVHVGDAAQNQFQLGLRYEPFTNFYIRPSFLLFSKYFADFNPDNIRNEESSTDSYRLPTSRNLDIHFGYELKPIHGARVSFRASVLNVLNEYYFTDVSNRNNSNVVDPNLIQAFFNRGRTFTVGMAVGL
ncbi:TonB-dependent receptor [Microvirga sp. STR05]|uniref:TonB-dependent receptor n=1 Tax=Hymenobacter duratus TaxID=2771356 RepID=A0ABR8JIR6_9BACT|nr:TonB-dependent receptor [Hymenobacter duratus]MBD2715616.1 TonB-dependent receptor [Hymenobacter duratus]MBR7950524.1 TonB-dependent receptor [Microvirga sp. STR05]